MLYNRYENEQKRISHELTNDRFWDLLRHSV
jgi:hypothetical protein